MVIKTLKIALCAGILTFLMTDFSLVRSGPSSQVLKPPIQLQASKFLSQEELRGPNFWVEDGVKNDGFINTYTMQTTYGQFVIESTDLLKIRRVELLAIEHMEKIRRTDVFKDAFKSAAKGPLKTVKGLITSPVKTVKGTVTGIGRWFSDVGRSIVSDDPHQEKALKTALGYAAAKRNFAYELGIDPYSSFKPLQDNLGELAWTAVGGGLTVKAAFSAIQETPGAIVRGTSTSASMRKLVRDNSPEQLEKINKDKLEKMGIYKSLIKAFLNNHSYNPQDATLLVGALTEMKNVKDKDNFIAEASLANSESVARFTRIRAQMMAGYHNQVAPVARLVDLEGALTFLQRKDGGIVGVFPLDHVASTDALWRKERNVTHGIKTLYNTGNKEIWLSGSISRTARLEFEARGWKVFDGAGNQLGIK